MFIHSSDVAFPLGMHPGKNETFCAINRTGGAVIVGHCYKLDIEASDGDVSVHGVTLNGVTSAFGSPNHPFSNVIDVETGDSDSETSLLVFCVALETGKDNKTQQWLLRGFTDIMGGDTTGANTSLTVQEADGEFVVTIANERVLAYGLEALTNAALHPAYFDGVTQAAVGDQGT